MTTNRPADLNKKLRMGIDAARTGNNAVAKAYLIAVLREEPNNIPAMLWLAFVLPSPRDTIRVLRRVLALDPTNERAQAGIRWARGQLGLDPDLPEQEEEVLAAEPEPAAESGSESAEDAFIRQQFFTGKVQKQAKKGVLAHRARRTIRPLLLLIIIMNVLGLTAIGLGALALLPPQTLAAWLPAPSLRPPVDPAAVDIEPVPIPTPVAAARHLAAGADVLALARPPTPLPEPDSAPAAPSPPGPANAPAPAEPVLPATNPTAFVGPELPAALPPAQNLLLAHQPAYPGEKWIEVNLATQQVTAWEGDKPVFSFIASTGLPNTPTITGKFHIYWKLEKTLMTGPGYYLPDVPYTMYFYGGYALHGTYWHNNFGQPMSHGCVNLETGNAKKLFEWAGPAIPPGQTQVTATADNPGTLVVVHQ